MPKKYSDESRAKMSLAHQGKSLSEEHRAAISAACRGHTMSDANKREISKRLKESHHRRYEWILIDPHGKMVRTEHMYDFCIESGLSYTALRYKAQQNDGTPVSRGPSKGWIVFAVKKPIKN